MAAVGATASQGAAIVQVVSTGTVEDHRLLGHASSGASSSSGPAAVQEKERCLRLCNLIYRLHCKLTMDQCSPGEPRVVQFESIFPLE